MRKHRRQRWVCRFFGPPSIILKARVSVSLARCCRAWAGLQLTAVRFSGFSQLKKIDRRHGALPGSSDNRRHWCGVQAMATAVHVVPDDSFDDWVVRGNVGQEFGHYPTREDAEQVAQAIAQAREAELVVHLPDGRTNRKSFRKGWVARLLDMIGRH
jgi:Uncharacterized protein conserved in bacteria (DUF2188)